MDVTDGDGEWIVEPGLAETQASAVLAVQARMEEVIDSGVDIAVAPLKLAMLGKLVKRSGILMQDAQGRRIPESESRVLEIEVETLGGHPHLVAGDVLHRPGLLHYHLNGARIEMGVGLWGRAAAGTATKRRNILTVLAIVSSIAAATVCGEPSGPGAESRSSRTPRNVNMMIFDDLGRLPPEAEVLAAKPGWHILPSGLPFFVAHSVDEVNVEQSLWSEGDWAWLALFVRVEAATRLPEVGDMWVQALTVKKEDFENTPKTLRDLDPDLEGRRDIAMVFHVEPDDDGEKEEELEGVKLSVDNPLKSLKEACRKLGLPVSGGKNKVLRRLRVHCEVLEKQIASEVARKIFAEQEQEREPGLLKTPILPSSRQQELHNVTHHPFQPWCEACVLGRSRQNPRRRQSDEPEGDELPDNKQTHPVIQLDYGYSFTKLRGEMGDDESRPGDNQGQPGDREGQVVNGGEGEQPEETVDVRDQYGLCLLGAESTIGWIAAVPVLEKGASSLKRVTEQLVRLSMQVCPGGTVVVKSDTEPSAKQVVNAVCACRSKLGLKTETRWISKASHGSNGQVEKGLGTIRRNALTLKAFVEDRVKRRIEGHYHTYSWFLPHAAFLCCGSPRCHTLRDPPWTQVPRSIGSLL